MGGSDQIVDACRSSIMQMWTAAHVGVTLLGATVLVLLFAAGAGPPRPGRSAIRPVRSRRW